MNSHDKPSTTSVVVMKTKTIEGKYSWEEAKRLEGEGWRLPTIFELIVMQEESGRKEYKRVWSASTFAYSPTYSWAVYSDSGDGYVSNKTDNLHVLLVRSGQFVHSTPVSGEEIAAFKKDGTLPEWHPPINFEEMKRMIELTRAEALMILRHLSTIEGFLWTRERSSDALGLTDESIKLLTEKLEVEDGD